MDPAAAEEREKGEEGSERERVGIGCKRDACGGLDSQKGNGAEGLAHAAASVERKFRDMGERPEENDSLFICSPPLMQHTTHTHTHTQTHWARSPPSLYSS